MTHRPLALACLLLLAACGDDSGRSGRAATPDATTPEAKTRAAIEAVLAAVKANDAPALAARIVYRGSDHARRWNDLVDYANEEDKARVDGLLPKIAFLLAKGDPRFLEFRTTRESEGQWLLWKVAFGEGADAPAAIFAMLEVKGTIALGDIDD
jgi:hypothetical protein